MEQYLTIRAVAKIIGVTPLTLRNWDKKGQLTAYRNPINNYRVYRYADIADFIIELKNSKSARGITQRIQVVSEDQV